MGSSIQQNTEKEKNKIKNVGTYGDYSAYEAAELQANMESLPAISKPLSGWVPLIIRWAGFNTPKNLRIN